MQDELPVYFKSLVQTLVENYCPQHSDNVIPELWQLLSAIDRGSFCIKIDKTNPIQQLLPQLTALVSMASKLSPAPLVYDDGFLYLHRTYSLQEELKLLVKKQLIARTQPTTFWDQVSSGELEVLIEALALRYPAGDELKRALHITLNSDVLILSGGPGVGKTYSVAVLLQALQAKQQKTSAEQELNVLLLAPTGRAVARMGEAIASHAAGRVYEGQTLHKVLGYNPIKGSFTRGKDNPLEADVIVVDESSMIDAYLFCQLLRALPFKCKLILVGDADQLPSVDIGALFWSLVVDRDKKGHKLAPNIVFLTTTYRSNTEILELALAFLRGDTLKVLATLQTLKAAKAVRWLPAFTPDELYRLIVNSYGLKPLASFKAHAGAGVSPVEQAILDEYFAFFDNFVVLTPINQGVYGVQGINQGVMRLLDMENHAHGLPILLTANISTLGLSNGDRGVLVFFGTVLYAVFKQNGVYRLHLPSQLSRYESAFAITVHKSQGSEYSRVLLVMAESSERVLNGRLTYTALTRAKTGVVICAAMSEVVRAAQGMPERMVRLGEVLCPPPLMMKPMVPRKGSQLGLF